MNRIVRCLAFTTEECDTCGVVFALTEDFVAAREEDHRTWYCPNGHQWHYAAETELERTKRRLARAVHCCDQKTAEVEHLEARVRGYKSAWVREKNKREES